MKLETNNAQTSTEQLTYRGTISTFPIICGLIIAVFVLMIFSNLYSIKKTRAIIEEQKQTIADFKKTEKEQDEIIKTKTNIELAENEDPAVIRRATDDDVANQLFEILLNWRTFEEYNNARSAMMSVYGLTEDSTCLTNVLPPVDEEHYNSENMRFNVAKTYELVNDGSGTISYFALCRVSTNISGNMARGTVGVFYSVTADGTIIDISAYPVSSY